MLKGVNWMAVIMAVVLLEVLGFLWYGPLFGEAWAAALGHAPDTSDITMKMSLGVVNTLIIVVGLAWLNGKVGAVSLTTAMWTALAAWFFFDFTTMAIDWLYVGHTEQLVAINMGYQLISYLVAAAVLGLLKPKAGFSASPQVP